MIIDSLTSSSRYVSLHQHFAKAFEYINNTDLNALEVGKFDIDGDNISRKENTILKKMLFFMQMHQICISI